MFLTRLILSLAEFGLSILLSILVIFSSYKGFLWMSPQMDAEAEIHKGNAAVAIMLASLMAGSALIMRQSIYPVVSILMVGLTGESGGAWGALRLAGYAAGHLAFGFLLSVACVQLSLKSFEKLTGDLDEEEAIRKGNVAVAVLLAAVVLILSTYMEQGVSALTKSLIPQPKLGGLRIMQ